jgi:PPOX class probable FMN-dependent enzyme
VSELCPGDLKTIYPEPTARVVAKARPEIDIHAKKFIEMSPFCVLATSGSDGSVDASPRGGHPGFVHVDGPHVLLMPDRPGNNRIDSFKNIVEGSGSVADDLFRARHRRDAAVGGSGTVTTDPACLAAMKEFSKLPRAVLRVDVTQAYFHCGKALMRSKLWSRDTQVERDVFPSISQVIHDQTRLGEAEPQSEVEARYKTQL